ncbi:MAG: thermonuclease family protein [Candidatus Omnitrophota bacterium]|jgi:micrococcal nuclease
MTVRRSIKYVITLAALLATSLIINSSRHINFTAQSNNSGPRNQYIVTRVSDGDTIELANGETVRYIGIDTPEIREKDGSGWSYNPMPYAERAREFNKKFIGNKPVRLEFDVRKKDKYNRLLAYVYIEDKMANIEIVKEGLAMIYTYPPNIKYSQDFLDAQKEAKDNERGLWAGLEENKIPASEAKNNIGRMMMVESEVVDTHLTEKLVILKFKGNFKVVIYKNNIPSALKEMMRSPDSYFKGKKVRVYGIIKNYKGNPEIVLHDMSQLEIL